MAKRFRAAINTSQYIRLQQNGTIRGAVSGRWERAAIIGLRSTVDGKRYNGVFTRQWEPESAELRHDLQRAVEAGRGHLGQPGS